MDKEALRRRCEALAAEFFAGRALIIASNRAPVTFERAEDGSLTFERSGGGGLVTALIDLCREHNLMTVYHGCGDARAIFEDFVEIGLDGYNPLEAKARLDAVELKKQYGGRLAFVGNVDMRVLEGGDPDQIRREIRYKLQAAHGGGWVCQSDHSVSSNVAPEDYELAIHAKTYTPTVVAGELIDFWWKVCCNGPTGWESISVSVTAGALGPVVDATMAYQQVPVEDRCVDIEIIEAPGLNSPLLQTVSPSTNFGIKAKITNNCQYTLYNVNATISWEGETSPGVWTPGALASLVGGDPGEPSRKPKGQE